MKKIIITIIILVLLIAGAFFYFQTQKQAAYQNFVDNVQPDTNAATKTISMTEVAQHNQKTDCWMIIDKDVLNVTAFVDKHPGGDVIVQGCGKDATEYFNGVRQHMKPFVKALAQKMVIGKLQD